MTTHESKVKIEQRTITKIDKIIASGKPGSVTIKGVKVLIDPINKITAVSNDKIDTSDEKTGGFLPLLALIPIIAKAVAAAGVLTGGIATAAKVGHDWTKGSGLPESDNNNNNNNDNDSNDNDNEEQRPPCKTKIIDAIITLHKAGFTLMRM